MQGIGNDFVVFDALRQDLAALDFGSLAPTICDRRRGVGGDGILLLERGQTVPLRMRMWNPDGSESEMCGNGLRCVAALARDRGYVASSVDFETGAGVLRANFIGDQVAIDMGFARLTRKQIGMIGPSDESFQDAEICGFGQATAVSMGNPHLVLFLPDVDAIDLPKEGAALESHALFPERTNVHFSQVLSRDEVRIRIWERGAGATLACGTGACAVAVAGVVTGRLNSSSTIHLPGGDLQIDVAPDCRVTMTGPAKIVFEGQWQTSQPFPFFPAMLGGIHV